MKPLDQLLTNISRDHLGLSTLKVRHGDSLDFHDVAVWQVEAALKAAFDAGVSSTAADAETQEKPPEAAVSVAAMPNSLVVPKGTPHMSGKMYLRLYHGRIDPAQDMDEWGFIGPTFGPLACYVHTYCCTFRIHGEFGTHEVWLEKHDDMIVWDGCFYGDMEVFIAGTDEKA